MVSFLGTFSDRFLEASWRHCHSSSGFRLFQLVLFLHVWSTGCCQTPHAKKKKSHWIIKIYAKMNAWKCELIFPTDTIHQNKEITDL